jgi:ABC-type amino acid transport system permease subunit
MFTLIALSLAGVVIAIVVGTLWHMPQSPMGRLHMRHLGFDRLTPEEQQQKMEEAKPTMPKIYAAQMLLSLLTSVAVVLIVTMSIQNGVPLMMALGFVVFNWLCFIVPTVGGHILWGNYDATIAWQKFFADALYPLVTMLLIALLASCFA